MRTKRLHGFPAPIPNSPAHDFAARLLWALKMADAPVTGAASLEREFNQRYMYRPVTRQTTHAWMRGRARPSLDKIEVLAAWLEVSSKWLAFGGDRPSDKVERRLVAKGEHGSPLAAEFCKPLVDDDFRDLEVRFHRLNREQRQIVIDLIDQMLLARA